ncbi:uncharacterized protein FTOL_13806 [Fusarium torulosum]|uniref:Uncharacterized protein n=1 Tax=Fusarium torulosum TaxID=33205 RepID=A0AAE8MPI3_9HYPO|nr:uncharacterized protein FTOL_13806 [Fusarium torulosum]
MVSGSIWQCALLFILALINPIVHAQQGWLVHDPVSGGGGPAFNPRSCVWVATQAFAGWGSRTVTVTAHNYIRWGQTGCVLQIANTSPTSFSVQGGQLRSALLENLILVAEPEYPVHWGNTVYRSSLQNIIIMVAHAKFFNGNVGNPVKRDTDRFDNNLTAANPADNEFAAHVAGLDFDNEPKELLDTELLDFAVKPREESRVVARSESKDSYLARRQIRWVLRGCVRNRQGDGAPNAFTEECTCAERNGAQEYYVGVFTITCNGDNAATATWGRGPLFNALGNLVSRIQSLNTNGWGNTVTVNSNSVGTVLFTSVGGGWGSRPSTAEARCCQEAIHHLINEGYTGAVFPGQCNCDGGFTNDDWQMLISNPIGIPS